MDIRSIPPRFQRMMNAQGFREMVNEEYQAALREDPRAFRIDSFDKLNEEFRKYFCCYRYIDYDSFTAAERRARKDVKDRVTGQHSE